MTGKRLGDWTVLKKAGINSNNSILWLCRCVCGNRREVQGGTLRIGGSKSCGHEGHSSYLRTHGMTKSRLYSIWGSMRDRCLRKSHMAYHNYGGRGIKIEWKDFIEFRDDMFESYLEHVKQFGEKQTTIDREDNDGNYCKQNCRWATYKEQRANSRQYKK